MPKKNKPKTSDKADFDKRFNPIDLRRVDEIEAKPAVAVGTNVKVFAAADTPNDFVIGLNREVGFGYHVQDIAKGVFGEPNKVFEEAHEFMDASQQGCSVMAILELSDLYGAMQGYLEKYHPTITMDDLAHMSDITQRAFKNGHRD